MMPARRTKTGGRQETALVAKYALGTDVVMRFAIEVELTNRGLWSQKLGGWCWRKADSQDARQAWRVTLAGLPEGRRSEPAALRPRGHPNESSLPLFERLATAAGLLMPPRDWDGAATCPEDFDPFDQRLSMLLRYFSSMV